MHTNRQMLNNLFFVHCPMPTKHQVHSCTPWYLISAAPAAGFSPQNKLFAFFSSRRVLQTVMGTGTSMKLTRTTLDSMPSLSQIGNTRVQTRKTG